MSESALTREQMLNMLAQAPPRIAEYTAGLTPVQLHAAPNEDSWSAREVLAHLRACADVWGDCMAAILAQDKPTLRAINPRSWIKRTDYREQDFPASLHAFTTQRTALLARLESLAPDDWSRAATVTGAGAVLERTVLFYAHWMAIHERPHLKQIQRIARMPREGVTGERRGYT